MDKIFVYVVTTGSTYEGGWVEDVYATLETARSTKSDKYNDNYGVKYDGDEIVSEYWTDSECMYYFQIMKAEVNDNINDENKLKTCSFNGCKFREEDCYYSLELNKTFKDICRECGPEATKDAETMVKALN